MPVSQEIMELDKGLCQKNDDIITHHLDQISDYLNIVDDKEKQRRIDKIVASECQKAILIKDVIASLSEDARNSMDYTLKSVIEALKQPKIISLDLSSSNLYTLGAERLATIIQLLQHTHVTSLDLTYNDLALLRATGLTTVIKALQPTRVTSISLGCNNLDELDIAEFVTVIEALQHTQVTSLDLSNSGLYEYFDIKNLQTAGLKTVGATGLVTIIEALQHTQVTSLNLSENSFHELNAKVLVTVFKALQHTQVASLHLGEFDFKIFNKFNEDELIDLFQHLPLNLKQLKSYDDFDVNDANSDIDTISDIETTINFPEFFLQYPANTKCQAKLADYANYMLCFVNKHVQENMQCKDGINFENMARPFQIDDRLLPILIHSLEDQQSSIASFTCALLLTNAIPSFTSRVLSDQHYAKCWADGITFLLHAYKQATDEMSQQSATYQETSLSLRDHIQLILSEKIWAMRCMSGVSKKTHAFHRLNEHCKQFIIKPSKKFFSTYASYDASLNIATFFSPIPRRLLIPRAPHAEMSSQRKRQHENKEMQPQYYKQCCDIKALSR